MPSVRQPESIAKPVVTSTTTVTVGASRVNLGGQQYVTTSNLTLNAGLTGANGIDTGSVTGFKPYFIHFILVAGVVALLASLSKTAPVLPSGVTQYRWSGWAFVANDQNQIKIIVNNTTWDEMTYSPNTANFAGFGTPNSALFTARRDGSFLEVRGTFNCGTVGATTGSVPLPGPLLFDPTNISANHPAGLIYVNGNINGTFSLFAATSNTDRLFMGSQGPNANAGWLNGYNVSNIMGNGTNLGCVFRIPISGWSATDI